MKTAVSRLSFAPKAKDMRVTDVKNGHFVFVPRPGKPVAYGELVRSVTKAGYSVQAAWIEVRGKLDGTGRIEAAGTGQRFALAGDTVSARPGATVDLLGSWRPAEAPGAADTIEVRSWKVAP